MKVYWIKLQEGVSIIREWGITAANLGDALYLLNQSHLLDAKAAAADVEAYREVHNVDELDPRHVVPNMGVLVRRGIWYPNLNTQ